MAPEQGLSQVRIDIYNISSTLSDEVLNKGFQPQAVVITKQPSRERERERTQLSTKARTPHQVLDLLQVVADLAIHATRDLWKFSWHSAQVAGTFTHQR